MQKGLVSVITPCYNTAGYVSHLLDSILSQTYPYLQMYVIDDGSTDGSSEIISEYIPRFEQRGYQLSCVRQSNSGQSVAIQHALQMVSGEFLVWPDSDDYYASPEAIEKMVTALQQTSSEFAMVRVQEQVVDETTGRQLYIQGNNRSYEEPASLFEDCLFVRNGYYFCSGGYMVRMDALVGTTGLSIYTAKDAGQNWQLMLPILYRYRCLTIPEVLYTVVNRKASHSRGQFSGYEKTLHKLQVYEDTIQHTLDRIQMAVDTRTHYKWAVRVQYLYKKLLLDYKYTNSENFLKRYKLIREAGIYPSLMDKVLLWSMRCHLVSLPLANKAFRYFYYKFYRDKY